MKKFTEKILENFNENDENNVFVEMLDLCIERCNDCLDIESDDIENYDDYEDILNCMVALCESTKVLCNSLNTEIFDVQKDILDICAKKCISALEPNDDIDACALCIEACKRCSIDCSNS